MLVVLPLRREEQEGLPFLTLLVCAACAIVFAFTQQEATIMALAFDPHHPRVLQSLSSAFVHGGLLHLVGNLFFFYCFAGAIEQRAKVFAFVLVFLVMALGTDLAYAFVAKGTLPTVGISGVVTGFMGMFLVRYPRDRIECLVWFLWVVRRIQVPGVLFVLSYVAFDYIAFRQGEDTGVNHAAHLYGFVIGAVLQLLFWRWIEHDDTVPARTPRERVTRR